MPTSGLFYRKFIRGLDKHKAIMEKRYSNIVSNFDKVLGIRENVQILDAIPILSSAIGEKNIIEAPFDYHLNDHGMDILFKYVCNKISETKNGGCG